MSDDAATPATTDTTTTAAPDSARGMRMASIAAILLLLLVIVLLLLRVAGASPAANLVEDVDVERVQAVYLTNDRVFFGALEAGEGEWLVLRDATFLRRSAAPAAAGEDAEGQGEQPASSTDLVPFEQEVGGDGDMIINAAEIVLVQNLDEDSEIARALEDR